MPEAKTLSKNALLPTIYQYMRHSLYAQHRNNCNYIHRNSWSDKIYIILR
ncbi:hypothetical protein RSAG8_05923, partial [Rhizoctonia solani AG-8 WAC10335]